MLLAVESPRVDLRHGGGDVGAGDVADPGPIRGEHLGHVTRSQPITAHLGLATFLCLRLTAWWPVSPSPASSATAYLGIWV